MRRKISYITFAAALILAALPGRAQVTGAGAFYNRPSRLELERTAKRLFVDYRREFRGQDFGVEGFYPIGWSKDGKFAYLTEPVDEACNCYFAKLFIVDLKSDKVLWSFDYDSDFLDEAAKAKKPYTLDTLWRANRELFSGKLREYGIEQRGPLALQSFPILHNGDSLTTELKVMKGGSQESRPYGAVANAKLQLVSKRAGRKTVMDQSWNEEYGKPLHVGTVGYLKSPFEPRVAVVLLEINRGYEGPPNVGSVRIVGADLSAGFK